MQKRLGRRREKREGFNCHCTGMNGLLFMILLLLLFLLFLLLLLLPPPHLPLLFIPLSSPPSPKPTKNYNTCKFFQKKKLLLPLPSSKALLSPLPPPFSPPLPPLSPSLLSTNSIMSAILLLPPLFSFLFPSPPSR